MYTKLNGVISIILLILVLFTNSCLKVVQDEFPDINKKPVLNAVLIMGDTIKVHVSSTEKIDNTNYDYIDNAEVLLYANNELVNVLEYDGDGFYTSNIIAESGIDYRCELFIPGKDQVESSCNIPMLTPISDLEIIPYSFTNSEGQTYSQINFTFPNNPQVKSYYQVLVFEKRYYYYYYFEYDNNYNTNIIDISESTDYVLLNEGMVNGVFSNELISGTEYRMSLNCLIQSPFIIELRSISYDYYLFLKDLSTFKMNINIIPLTGSSAPYPIHSNVKNGKGIFSGYSVYKTDTLRLN